VSAAPPHNRHCPQERAIRPRLTGSFILPDYPATSKRMSPHNRVFAQYRMDRDFGTRTVGLKDVPAMHGFRMAVKDVRTWIFGEPRLVDSELTR